MRASASRAETDRPRTSVATHASPRERRCDARVATRRESSYGVFPSARSEDREIGATERNGLIRVRLDLVIRAANDVVASQNYGKLRGALAAKEWCVELSRPNTYPLDETTGILVKGLQVEVRLANEELVGDRMLGVDYDMDATIRSLAADGTGELGPVAISPSTRQSKLSVDRIFKIAPHSKEVAVSLDKVLEFASSLEGASNEVVVTEIRLRPSKKTSTAEEIDEWKYELAMTVRERAG